MPLQLAGKRLRDDYNRSYKLSFTPGGQCNFPTDSMYT
jgi:hypothetical protein